MEGDDFCSSVGLMARVMLNDKKKKKSNNN